MTDEAVSLRTVQELIERLAKQWHESADNADDSAIAATRRLCASDLIGAIRKLPPLPSTNAQAVAWQWREIGSNGRWSEGTKEEFDCGVTGYEYRALFVCSGDAKEA